MKNISNNVRLIGNLGTDPEVKELASGKTVAKFPVATTDYYKSKEGERISDTQWHNIVAWGNTAKIAEKIFKKGFKVAVEGKLTSRSYETSEGQKRYVTEVIANELLLLKGDQDK
jgi:single-strand DNA-binding protein